MADISKKAIPDILARKNAVEAAFRAELVARGAKPADRIGKFEDGTSIGFRIQQRGQSYCRENRLSITMGGYGHAQKGQAYAEPKGGYDVGKMVDRILERYEYQRERDEHNARVSIQKAASNDLVKILAEEFPELRYAFGKVSSADSVMLNTQPTMTLDQARQMASLLMKFKAERS